MFNNILKLKVANSCLEFSQGYFNCSLHLFLLSISKGIALAPLKGNNFIWWFLSHFRLELEVLFVETHRIWGNLNTK